MKESGLLDPFVRGLGLEKGTSTEVDTDFLHLGDVPANPFCCMFLQFVLSQAISIDDGYSRGLRGERSAVESYLQCERKDLYHNGSREVAMAVDAYAGGNETFFSSFYA